MRVRASVESATRLHQQPDADSSHANGCPQDPHVSAFFSTGPAGPQLRLTFIQTASAVLRFACQAIM
jgi:hypothetical protein